MQTPLLVCRCRPSLSPELASGDLKRTKKFDATCNVTDGRCEP